MLFIYDNQSQPNGLESPMLHTKFCGNRSAGSGEDFEGFLPYMGVAILVMSPTCFKQNFVPPTQGGIT